MPFICYYQATIDGLNITNTLEAREPTGTLQVAGKKTWVDDGTGRPGFVNVRLLRDGEAYQKRTVTAANDWHYSFDKLPTDDGYGHAYTYTVREDGVEGYFARYRGYDIVNTRLAREATPGEPTPEDAGQTPEDEDLTRGQAPQHWRRDSVVGLRRGRSRRAGPRAADPHPEAEEVEPGTTAPGGFQ